MGKYSRNTLLLGALLLAIACSGGSSDSDGGGGADLGIYFELRFPLHEPLALLAVGNQVIDGNDLQAVLLGKAQ